MKFLPDYYDVPFLREILSCLVPCLQIDSLQATIRQLESERNQMIENLNTQRDLTDHLGVKVSDLEEEVVQSSKLTNNLYLINGLGSMKFNLYF